MKSKTENEKLFQNFLFGELPENERFELEEKLITNTELFNEIKAFEDDLIEKYVRGWMNPAEKSKFEQKYLTTKKAHEKVEFSCRLIQNLQVYKEDFEFEKIPFWEKFSKLFLTPKFAAISVFVILFSIFGGWFLLRNSETKQNEIVKNQNSVNSENLDTNLTPNIENDPVNSNKISENPINKANSNLTTPTPTPKITPEPENSPVQKIAPNPVLALFSGNLRADGNSNELKFPETAKGAILQLNLENIDFKIYQAEMTDADGNVIFKKGLLKPQKSEINLFVPAKNLKKGDFVIKLYGKNDSGENESVADFQFRIK